MLTFVFLNDTATTEIYTLPLHDALPISSPPPSSASRWSASSRPSTKPPSRGRPSLLQPPRRSLRAPRSRLDRKSTRLNSSHANISYAVFCFKKKKYHTTEHTIHPYLVVI